MLDPWDRVVTEDVVQPRVLSYSREDMVRLWTRREANGSHTYPPHFGAVALPWRVVLAVHHVDGSAFTVTAEVTYSCPAPFLTPENATLVATGAVASVSLPRDCTLVKSSSAVVPLGDLAPGGSARAEWRCVFGGQSPASLHIAVWAHGRVTASVPQYDTFFPGYEYGDDIGGRSVISFSM